LPVRPCTRTRRSACQAATAAPHQAARPRPADPTGLRPTCSPRVLAVPRHHRRAARRSACWATPRRSPAAHAPWRAPLGCPPFTRTPVPRVLHAAGPAAAPLAACATARPPPRRSRRLAPRTGAQPTPRATVADAPPAAAERSCRPCAPRIKPPTAI